MIRCQFERVLRTQSFIAYLEFLTKYDRFKITIVKSLIEASPFEDPLQKGIENRGSRVSIRDFKIFIIRRKLNNSYIIYYDIKYIYRFSSSGRSPCVGRWNECRGTDSDGDSGETQEYRWPSHFGRDERTQIDSNNFISLLMTFPLPSTVLPLLRLSFSSRNPQQINKFFPLFLQTILFCSLLYAT